MASIQYRSVTIKPLRIDAFSGGINTSAPANEIADNEAVDIQNMEFDESNNLQTRNGVDAYTTSMLWDVSLWDVGAWDVSSTDLFVKKITSIYDFQSEAGFVGILYTAGNSLYSRLLGGTRNDITPAIAIPDGTRWYWKQLNGVAVGVNTGNTVRVVGPAPGTATVSNAPKGNFIEVWNSRVWIARADFPNQLQSSNIGDPDTWDTDAGVNPAHGAIFDIDKNDSDQIMGLYATKERLFVFKRRSIFVVEVVDTTQPSTDMRNLKISKYANNLGCIAATTIRAVFDDVLFLSEGGVASLSAAQVVADFRSALVSLKIKDIISLQKVNTADEVFAFTLGDVSQYWLSVSAAAGPQSRDVVYVLDFKEMKQNIIRWVMFDGFAFNTAMEVYDHNTTSQLTYIMGCHSAALNRWFMGYYTPKASTKRFSDGTFAYSKSVLTKSYDFGQPDLRKLFTEWFVGLELSQGQQSMVIDYFYNQNNIADGNYSFSFPQVTSGALYDVALFDVDKFDVEPQGLAFNLIRRAFLFNKSGRKAVNVQMKIHNEQVNQGYKLKSFGVKAGDLSENRTQTV